MAHRPFLIAAMITLASSLHPSAATVLPIKFDELVSEAQTIVRGQIVDVRSDRRDRGPGAPIVTSVTVRVLEVFKGNPPEELTLEFLGGTIGDLTLAVSDMPQFKTGERDFLFINTTGNPMSPLVGFFAGRWRIHVDAFTGREFVTTGDGRLLTSVADVDPRPAQSLSTMRPQSPTRPSITEIGARIREKVRR